MPNRAIEVRLGRCYAIFNYAIISLREEAEVSHVSLQQEPRGLCRRPVIGYR